MWSIIVVFLLCCGDLESGAVNRRNPGESCETPNKESAKCISIDDCTILYDAVTTKDPEQKKFLQNSQCGWYDSRPFVCCGTRDNYITNITSNTLQNNQGIPGQSCTTPNRESAKCVSIHDCKILYNAVTTKDPKQKEFLQKSQCGWYGSRPLVCCGTRNNYKPKITTNSLLPNRTTCGFQAYNRILGGNKTEIDEFPWMALLQYVSKSGQKKFACGGTLISSRYVLTAAHCVTGRILHSCGKLTMVRLGEWNTDQGRDCVSNLFGIEICNDEPMDFGIERVVFHPEYYNECNDFYCGIEHQHYDIALVRLDRDVNYTDFIRPICLSQLSEESRPGDKLIVAGWGHTENRTFSSFKLKVQVPFVSRNQCVKSFPGLGEGQICAGGERNKDSCFGDSGGPLMTHTKNDTSQWYIEGIVSSGKGCGSEGVPAVYTKVSYFLDWICENIEA